MVAAVVFPPFTGVSTVIKLDGEDLTAGQRAKKIKDATKTE